jgi:hypothetical protein
MPRRTSRKSANQKSSALASKVTNDIVNTVTNAGKSLSKTVTGSSNNLLTKTTDVAGRAVTVLDKLFPALVTVLTMSLVTLLASAEDF